MAIRNPGPAPPIALSLNKENDDFLKKNAENSIEIDKLMKKIEDRLFLGRTTSYKIFDLFDVDKDGNLV